MNNKKALLFGVLAFAFTAVNAQVKIGDNPTTIDGDAIVEMESTNKGMLLPRVALTARDLTTPLANHVAGMTVYNTNTAGTGTNAVEPGYYYNDGTQWVRIQPGADSFEFAGPVFINNTDPNTATEFDDVPTIDEDGNPNPEFVDDPSLEMDPQFIYSGTDGSSWIWNGTMYVTYTASFSTPWYLAGGTVDAGGNKTINVWRTGNVGIGTEVARAPRAVLDVETDNADETILRLRNNPNTASLSVSSNTTTGAAIEMSSSNDDIAIST